MKQLIFSTHLYKLLLIVISITFSFSAFAQSQQAEVEHRITIRSCEGYIKLDKDISILALEMELSNLQSFRTQARRLKRKLRAKKRELRREEHKLANKIQDIEEYVKVDERLTNAQRSNYKLQIETLSLQLMQVRADKRKVSRLYRRAKRLLRNKSSYHYSYSCDTSNEYNHCYSDDSYDTNPWWIAFAALFSINLLIGGVIAYRTLRK